MLSGGAIRLGLLGCADVASRRVLPAVLATEGITLAAVASRNLAKAQAVAGQFGGVAGEGYEWLLDHDGIDAVYLPLPAGLHYPWIRRALEAGKHVLAEKPLTTSLAESAQLIGLAQAAGLVLRENFMFVHHSQHEFVRNAVASGMIGDLRSITATFAIPARPAGDIRYQRELGGGALLDVGGYPLRAAQLLLGQQLEVVGAALRFEESLGVDVGGGALLQRDDGVIGHLGFGLQHRYTSTYQLLGSTGQLSVEHAFTPPATHRPSVRLQRQDHQEEFVLAPDDQCANAVAAFVHAIRNGPLVDDSILAQAALVDGCHRGSTDRGSAALLLAPMPQLDGSFHGR